VKQYSNNENTKERKHEKERNFFGVFVFSWLLYCSVRLTLAAGDAPVISHVPVNTLRSGEDFVVEATVSSRRPIARVGMYRQRIPAARLGGSFRYIIFATDDGGRTSTWPAPPAAANEPRGHLVTLSK
jgi:hypothetical protein